MKQKQIPAGRAKKPWGSTSPPAPSRSLSNALGCYAAAYLNPPTELVSYLLIAMFLGIWVNYLTDRKMIITGLVSGLLAILLSQIVPYKLHIVLATLAASGAACYITERHAGRC